MPLINNLDDKSRGVLKNRLELKCKQLLIPESNVTDNASYKALDVNASRVSSADVASLIDLARLALRDMLNLHFKDK